MLRLQGAMKYCHEGHLKLHHVGLDVEDIPEAILSVCITM